MQNYTTLTEYFKDFLEMIEPAAREKVIAAYKLVDDNFWTMPAASGNHHSELQACEHGLMYHIYEGLIAMEQFIRARSDVINRWKNDPAYEGSTPESDLFTAYLMHDICKFKSNPSGSNYTHDEDGYLLCVALGFNPVVCEIVRFTHGQWSTVTKQQGKKISDSKYADLCWISHYSDMAASTMRPLKFIEHVRVFDKSYFKANKDKKATGDISIDKVWWGDTLRANSERVMALNTQQPVSETHEKTPEPVAKSVPVAEKIPEYF